MPTATFPTPNYIGISNVEPLIGDKVLFSDSDSTGISTINANMLISAGESMVLEDLSPYYVTNPALITTMGQTWDNLPKYIYSIIYDMFVYRSSLQIIGSFIAKNTDEIGRTLSYFQKYYQSEYNNILNRILDKLPNGSYKFQLVGLQTLNTGIQRKPKRYAQTGNLGADNYTDGQVINPARNFDVFWGVNSYGRNGSYNGGG